MRICFCLLGSRQGPCQPADLRKAVVLVDTFCTVNKSVESAMLVNVQGLQQVSLVLKIRVKSIANAFNYKKTLFVEQPIPPYLITASYHGLYFPGCKDWGRPNMA